MTKIKVCPGWGSNSRPSDYETDALPTALPRLLLFPFKFLDLAKYFGLRNKKNVYTHGGTRTPNLRFRRPTPYPLGHAGILIKYVPPEFGYRKYLPQKYKKNICVARESNPGRKNGNLAWYHYTSDAIQYYYDLEISWHKNICPASSVGRAWDS